MQMLWRSVAMCAFPLVWFTTLMYAILALVTESSCSGHGMHTITTVFHRARAFIFFTLLSGAVLISPGMADTLANIRAKGEIVVGTKADVPAYGFRNTDGQIAGLEPDLAADLARRLGVKLHIVPVLTSNREQTLLEGKVDVLIATVVISPERERVMGFIDPPYYAGGLAGLARRGAGINSEDDLKGREVCAIKGNFFNQDLQSLYVQKELVIVDGVKQAERVLQEGRCIVLAYSNVMLLPLKKDDAETWKDYDFVEFTGVDPQPWGIAVRREDRSGAFAKFLSLAVLDWHGSGLLANLEKKWLGTNTPWVVGLREKYRTRRGSPYTNTSQR